MNNIVARLEIAMFVLPIIVSLIIGKYG